MAQEIRQRVQAEAELLPPALQRLDQLQMQVQALQTAQLQMQQLLLRQSQQLEELRSFILRVGQLLTQINKQTRPKEKKSWMPWIPFS